jgi:hypothetical protein
MAAAVIAFPNTIETMSAMTPDVGMTGVSDGNHSRYDDRSIWCRIMNKVPSIQVVFETDQLQS